jgi:hypothetical protein
MKRQCRTRSPIGAGTSPGKPMHGRCMKLPEIPVRRPTGTERGPGHAAPRIVCSALPQSETRPVDTPIRLIGAFVPGL